MANKTGRNTPGERYVNLTGVLKQQFPHLFAWCLDPNDFIELRFKARSDGTILAVAKGYDPAGAPVVAFGSGYDVVLALMAIDASINGGNWRRDKPYDPSG